MNKIKEIYSSIINNRKKLALLIDPENFNSFSENTVKVIKESKFDYLFVGGSLISEPLDNLIIYLKKIVHVPIILFPGSILQISDKADAILFLSLISGRNPDFLIGHHVIAAPYLKKIGIEVIPTGYILIDGKNTTSVQYISNTMPIPVEKKDIVVATAIAGEMLGLKLIYLEGGSGAKESIPTDVVKKVKENINIPIIVGGGIKSPEEMIGLFDAGADIVVISTIIENNPGELNNFSRYLENYNNKTSI